MHERIAIPLMLFFLYALVPLFAHADPLPRVSLVEIASGLDGPVAITHAGDGSQRLFITLQDGRILIYDGTQVLPDPFLDISSLVSCCGERGLLSTAFHPEYHRNGWFFVYYTDLSGDTMVARYEVSADPNVADPSSAAGVLQLAQPFANHNGGQLQFGPDGFLYIGTGDGGSGGDPGNRAQNPLDLLGKILRIDVNGVLPYRIPPGNPFVDDPGVLDEIWALGLRNPWRFSFDRLTGDLFIGDVGQRTTEEINFQPAGTQGGENYGWRRMEGSNCFNPSSGCNDGTLVLPIVEYSHVEGCSVTGGYRYRGRMAPTLTGMYLFGDYCFGTIWGAVQRDGAWTRTELLNTELSLSTFGEDEMGELYVAGFSSGTLHRIVTSPLCEVQVEPQSFLDGEIVTATTVRLANPGTDPVATEVKLWVVRPDGTTQAFVNTGADGSRVLPAGFETDLGPVELLPVTASTPRGTYELSCRILDPPTGALLGEDRSLFDIE